MSGNQYKGLGKNWQAILTTHVRQAERWAGSQQRQRKLSVAGLVQTMVLGCLGQRDASLNDYCQIAQELGVTMGRASMDERINEATVMLLAGVLQESLRYHLPCPTTNALRIMAMAGLPVEAPE